MALHFKEECLNRNWQKNRKGEMIQYPHLCWSNPHVFTLGQVGDVSNIKGKTWK